MDSTRAVRCERGDEATAADPVVVWDGGARQVMQRARSLMDENVLKVTALVKELEAQRDQLQGDILAAQKREEVGRSVQRAGGLDRCLRCARPMSVEGPADVVRFLGLMVLAVQELRVEKAQLERQMEELQDKQIELDRIKYRAKLEVSRAARGVVEAPIGWRGADGLLGLWCACRVQTAEAFMKRLEEKEK